VLLQTRAGDHVPNDPTTNQLRSERWRPRTGIRYACGCNPSRLCGTHAAVRAVEEHHPDAARQRPTAAVTEAWTCPDCRRTYWPPKEWERELWPPLAEHIRTLHSLRHQQDRIVDRDAGARGGGT
jgi:hypothetical protein